MAHESTANPFKCIVIIGGSYGGISTTHYLLKHILPKLPNSPSYQIILVSAASQALCRPACPRALISDDMFDQQKLFVSTPKQFENYPKDSFRFIHGSATSLDHVERTVTVSLKMNETRTIGFHAIVIATGASTPSPLLGLNHDVEALRASWLAFREVLPTAKSIVIAGGGPTGVETAGELGEHLNGRAGWRTSKLENPKVAITLVTSASEILPVLRSSIAKKAEDYLAKVGVVVLKNVRVKSVNPAEAGTKEVASEATIILEDGRTLDADLYIPATGATPNTSFVSDALLTKDGRVECNSETLRVDKAGPRVYAVGDAASYARPAVHNILSAVPILGANMKRDLLLEAGQAVSAVGEDRIFEEDTRETQLVPIGRTGGVGAAMGWSVPSFAVWLIKGRDYWLWTTGDLWTGKQWTKEAC
ncbi:hypothetical protein ACHAQH_003961 [Verticillium albo-atrum]